MDSLQKQQAQERITQAQNILVAVNKKSSLDALAAGLALYLSLKKLGKNVTIMAKAPTAGDARLLFGVGDIGENKNGQNLVINIENAIKNVDKVSYYLDQSTLKIIIHAFPNSTGIRQEDITYDRTTSKPDVVMAIDYENFDEMKNDITHEQEIDPNVLLIGISAGKPVKKFTQIEVVDEESPSICELVAGFFQTMAFPIDEDISFNLYSGIANATQMFSPKLVKSTTFQTAAWLFKFGVGKASLAQTSMPISSTTGSFSQPVQQLSSEVKNKIDYIGDQLSSSQDKALDIAETPLEQVEIEKHTDKDWLKPPKIYRGSKSFDMES